MSYQSTTGEPMSWQDQAGMTPGKACVQLARARRNVERCVFLLHAAKASDHPAPEGYADFYDELGQAAAELVHAEMTWELQRAKLPGGLTRSDVELVK